MTGTVIAVVSSLRISPLSGSAQLGQHLGSSAVEEGLLVRADVVHVDLVEPGVDVLAQQLGRAPRPSEIADRLGLPISQVIEGLHAGQAYRSSSLEETLDSGDGKTALGELIGGLDSELALIDDREMLRPLLAELPRRERTILALRFFRQLTQTQIAEQVGTSQMHVSRLLRKTLTFLHERMLNPD